jgi:ribosomal-protein-alanine N-acetyltransferase
VTHIDDMREADIADVLAFQASSIEGRLKEELARPWARVRVARDDAGRAIGIIVAWVVADEVHVLDIAVHEKRRREGIARALLDDLTGDARARGARHVYLEVRRSNVPAIHLYSGAGFIEHNVRKAYYPDGEDALEMALSLE